MTPKEALTNLDAIVARFPGTRQEHMVLQESVETLQAALDGLEAALSSNPGIPPENDPEGDLS